MSIRMTTKRGGGRGFREKLRLFASGRARELAANATADALLDLVDEGFERRADPYGNPWAPRKPPTGPWPLLEKTRAMRTNYFALVNGGRVTLTNDLAYPGYHQTGTSRMVARKTVPDGPLPSAWEARIDEAVTDALKGRR